MCALTQCSVLNQSQCRVLNQSLCKLCVHN
uniref:Uncharacterized protein n=1 Tax=Anguilla anguilla TaxID=7936 RepID=A0A0E9S1Q2_ANGAN